MTLLIGLGREKMVARILFLTPYYPPEKGAASVRISENAKRLVMRGHEVTVLTTFPNYPTGIIPHSYRSTLLQRELIDGVHVVRVWSYIAPHKGFVRRILAQLSFACLTPILGGGAVGTQDILIVQSPPLFDAIAGRILAWMKQCPFIFMVSDLWPESAIQLNAVHNRLFIRVAQWLEWTTYQKACSAWALSQGIRDRLILRGLAPEHVFLLTNGADTSRFRPLPQKAARAELGWTDTFTVLYAGTHGVSHGLTTVLDAAALLCKHQDIQLLFVGDGSEKADLVAEAQKRALSNVSFLDALPHERLPLALSAADVCLVPMRNVPLFSGRLPLKMFEIMSSGRPFLLGVDGEARKIAVYEAGAALYVEPENAEALAAGVLYLLQHPEEAEMLGKRGRAYIERHFEREQLASDLEGHIVRLLQEKKQLPRNQKQFLQRTLSTEGNEDVCYSSLPSESTPSPFYICWHTTMDIVFGLLGFAVLLCVFPVLSLLICCSSPGPIFYHQERVGYQGKKFTIHKFRSMHVNAECDGQPLWAKEHDTRVTRIGRFLRTTHLDELPQIVNILRGEMSLIGPRPERQEFVVELEKNIPHYRHRLLVKPGLTGWAQVMYRYTNTEQAALVKSHYDLYYIRHRSFMLDISILLRTGVEVLFRRGL